MPATLALIPLEIIEQVLLFLDPLQVAAFSQTCKSFFNLVYASRDNHLWRTVATAYATLHHDDLLTLPCMQDRHTCSRATWLKHNRIDHVIRANDKCNVCC